MGPNVDGSESPRRPQVRIGAHLARRCEGPRVLYLELDQFMLELKEGSFQNVGGANKQGSAKLYDVEDAEAREFGDERVKLAFEDEDGSEVHVAISPEQAASIAEDVERIREEGVVFEEADLE